MPTFRGTSNLVGSPDMSVYETRLPIVWVQMRRGGLMGTDRYGHQYIIERMTIEGNREAALVTLAIRGLIVAAETARSIMRGKALATRMYGKHLLKESK